MVRTLFIALVAVVVSAAPAFAGAPARPRTAVEKFAGSQVVVTGKVTAIEKGTVEASSPDVGAKDKLKYKVAVVKIDTKLAGAENLTHIKVGFVPPDPNAPPLRGSGGIIRQRELVPELKDGQQVLLYLTKHPTADFYVMPYVYLPADIGTPAGKQELEEAKKFAAILADPMKGLKSDKAEVRAETAWFLLAKYHSYPVLGGEVEEVSIGAEESRLILKAIADGDWSQMNAIAAFYKLGLTDKNGWKEPVVKPAQNYITLTNEAFVKWLDGPGKDYQIKKYVSKK
jgi:hypothetical protein